MDLLERELSLRALNAAFAEAAKGSGRVVLIGGEAGIGKTSLVEHFTQELHHAACVLWGACDDLFTPRPLGPLHDVALQLSGDFMRLLDAETNRATLFAAFLADVQHQARPTVIVFEDVHWADEATLDLLKFIGRRIQRVRALLVITYRDDELGARHPLRLLLGDLATSTAVQRLMLEPLSIEAVRTLTQSRAVEPIALHQQTGGNPFFVTEVLANNTSGIPATVRDAVLARTVRCRHQTRGTEAAPYRRMSAVAVGGCSGAGSGRRECMASDVVGPRLLFAMNSRQTILDAIATIQSCIV
jgi:predicted ATPase